MYHIKEQEQVKHACVCVRVGMCAHTCACVCINRAALTENNGHVA